MDNKGRLGIGLIIFLLAMAIFALYVVFVYVPGLQENIVDSANQVETALIVGLICGIMGTIGILIERNVRL